VIRLGSKPLPRVDTFKYLGLHLNSKLTWSTHCNRVRTSALHAAFKISRVLTKTGPSPRVIRLLVQALVIPIISYAWPLWRPPTERHWQRLASAVCLPLRCVLGLPASTQKLALFVEFGLPCPRLLHSCTVIVYAHHVDIELGRVQPHHPAHKLFRQQRSGFLPKRCRRSRIPFAKAVITDEYRLGVDHNSDTAASIASLRKTALTKQIRLICEPDGKQQPSRFATNFIHRPAPTGYVMKDMRNIASLRARIRLNRHHLRDRQRKLKLIDDDRCPACVEVLGPNAHAAPTENATHVLLECPRFSTSRMQCSAQLHLCGTEMSMDTLTGFFANVPAQHREEARTVTAEFLSKVNKAVQF